MADTTEYLKTTLVDLGDGLYQIGDDTFPHCSKPVISVTRISANEVKYEYDNYYVFVTADGSGDERHNFHWKRVYK